jgi:hypothetical protein
MSQDKPYKCPVCGGSGQVPFEFYNPPSEFSTSVTVPAGPTTCRSCGGQGILWPPSEHTYTVQMAGFGDFSFDWSEIKEESGPPIGHVMLKDGEGNVIREAEAELSKGVEPAVPHDDLMVREEITDDAYIYTLLNPDGTEAAPRLVFHRGSPEEGWHGWTTAKVLAALIKHMDFHQRTQFACDENQVVLESLRAAHRATKIRADRRRERGVLYDWRKP